jgi:hypothetical protein
MHKRANCVHLQKLVNARSVSGEFQVIDAIIHTLVGVRSFPLIPPHHKHKRHQVGKPEFKQPSPV